MIIPSIDLAEGQSVQREEDGEMLFDQERPEALVREYFRFGEVAVIDLDAAFGESHNEDVIAKLCTIADCRVGGGIGSVEKADRIMSLGAKKLIVGKMALMDKHVNHQFLRALEEKFGRDRLILAVDTIEGEVVTRRGWQRTGLMWESVVDELEPYTSEFLFTCVEQDGVMRSTSREGIERMNESTHLPITAAGGVFYLDEIAILSKLGVNIQLGKALHTGDLKLSEAFVASLNWEKGFLPTVVIDENLQVLMRTYSDKESLLKTFETEILWFFSRSEGKALMQGVSSGFALKFLKIRFKPDDNELVLTVRQSGEIS